MNALSRASFSRSRRAPTTQATMKTLATLISFGVTYDDIKCGAKSTLNCVEETRYNCIENGSKAASVYFLFCLELYKSSNYTSRA